MVSANGRRALLVLAGILASALAAPAPSLGLERGFGAWIAACDNTHRCSLIGTEERGYVFLVRDPGNRQVRVLAAMSVDIADVQVRDIDLSLSAQGPGLLLSYVDTQSSMVRAGSAEGATFASALAAAQPGARLVLRSGNAGEIDIAVAGFADAWNWIDHQQKTASPAPVLSVAKTKQNPRPKKVPDVLAENWRSMCRADGAKKGDWGLLRVSQGLTVWRLSCGTNNRLFLYDERSQKSRLLRLPFPKPAGEMLSLERIDAIVALSPEVLGVTAYHLTNCTNRHGQFGFIGRWRWTGGEFELESFHRFGDEEIAGYDGGGCVPHEDWPSVYRAAAP